MTGAARAGSGLVTLKAKSPMKSPKGASALQLAATDVAVARACGLAWAPAWKEGTASATAVCRPSRAAAGDIFYSFQAHTQTRKIY